MGNDSQMEDSPAAAAAKKVEEQEGGGAKKAPAAGGLKKGPWTAAEDEILVEYVRKHGEGNWNRVQRSTGLARCGKSCRLRWANHLRPNLKKGSFTPEEELLILRLHAQLGNKWARMASQLPGRTDNEIKNYWNTRIKRRQRAGLPLYPPEVQKPSTSASAPPLGFFSGKPKFTAHRPPPLLNSIAFGAPPAPGMAAVSGPLARGPYVAQLSFPFSPIAPPPTPTSLFQQQPQPRPQPTPMAFGLGRYDAALPPLSSSLPAKVELPSCQFLYTDAMFGGNIAGGCPGDMLLQGASGATVAEEFKFCDLFSDAVPQLVQRDTDWSCIGGGGADGLYHREDYGGGMEASFLNSVLESAFKSDFLDSDFHEGINTKCEQVDIPNPAHDDLSSLCSIPTTIPEISDCCNANDAEHISNGQSSSPSALNVVDYLGLEMDQLASPLSIPTGDHDQEWNFGSCPWNNMPGIC